MADLFDEDSVETVEVHGVETLLEGMTQAVEEARADINDRRTFIGGSDAPVIIRVSPWKNRTQLWLEKTGQAPEPNLDEIEAVISGKYMEDVIARIYTWKFDQKLRRIKDRVVMDGAQFPAVAQIDRKVEGRRRIAEIKNVDISQRQKWGAADSGECPVYYYAQIEHQIMCSRYDDAEAVPFFGGNHVERRFIARDEEFIANLYEAEYEFWKLVQQGTPPEPETAEEAALLWTEPQPQKVSAEAIAAHLVGYIQKGKDEIKAIERRGGLAKMLLMRMMENLGDTLVVDKKAVCTWKTQKVRTFDLDAFRTAHPELVAYYTKETTSRVFRLAKAGKETDPDMEMIRPALIAAEETAYPNGIGEGEEDEEGAEA